jgi:hypothetical protein
MKEHLKVTVLSSDGWSWVLGWIQVGIPEVFCSPTTDTATQQLNVLQRHPIIGKKVKIFDDNKAENKIVICCVHITSITSLHETLTTHPTFLQQHNTRQCTFISHPPSTKLQVAIRNELLPTYNWHQLRHTTLGGLTTARLTIGWSGCPTQPDLINRKIPKRPLNRFLEPVARNVRWRTPSPNQLTIGLGHDRPRGLTLFPYF